MCRLVAVVALSLATMTLPQARAAPATADSHADEIAYLLKSGRRTKAAGQVLIGLGCVDAIVATVVGGIAVAAPADNLGDVTPGSIRGSQVPVLEGAAIGLAVAAAALIAVGAPLMAEGDARLGRAHKLVGAVSIRVAAGPRGLAITW